MTSECCVRGILDARVPDHGQEHMSARPETSLGAPRARVPPRRLAQGNHGQARPEEQAALFVGLLEEEAARAFRPYQYTPVRCSTTNGVLRRM